MKKFFALMLALCMLLSCTAAYATSFEDLQRMLNGGTTEPEAAPETETTQAPAQDEALVADCMDGLAVAKYCVMTKESNNYVYVYLFLEVVNTSNRAVETDGEFTVSDKSGKVVEDQSYLNSYPAVIGPGKTGYVSEYVMVSKKDTGVSSGADIGQVKVQLFRDAYNREPQEPVYTQSAAEVGSGENAYGNRVDNMFRVVVANTTGADLVNPKVVVALFDTQGQLVYVDVSEANCFRGLTIPNGNGFVTTGYMETDLSDALAANGITVQSVVSLAYME